MKNVLKTVIFIIYTISIFFINSIRILGILFIFDLILALILKLDYIKMLKYMKKVLLFIIFTMFINLIFDGLYIGIIIGIRMIICFIITYVFSKTITVTELSNAIVKILTLLTFFNINTNSIGLIISISICMIPILKEEITSIIKTVKSKGGRLNIHYLFIIMKPLIISIFKRTEINI